jgi:hypothetical protein
MVGQPDRDLPARREEALARLAVTTEALHGLEKALAAELGISTGTAQALLAGASALCPVAANMGSELAVSVGPHHEWTVDVGGDATGPQLSLRRTSTPTPPAWSAPAGPQPGGAQLFDPQLSSPQLSSPQPGAPQRGDVQGQIADLPRTHTRAPD